MTSVGQEEAPECRLQPPTDKTNRILIAEDDAMFRKILQTWLQGWDYQVTVTQDGVAAWDILQQDTPPELLILDWVMPELDGLELCRRIRARRRQPEPYILLVTGRDTCQDIVEGLEAGADDYLTKPFDRSELKARLRVGRRTLDLQSDLIRAREELRFRATHDALTRVWNRGAFTDLLRGESERSARSGSSTAALMLDLDHFKCINDTHGHLTGDLVLKEIAHRIVRSVRAYDVVGRYGGEEFAVVLPNCDSQHAFQIGERIRSTIAGTSIATPNASVIATVSIGVTAADSGTFSPNELLAAADAALYRAKKSGRNRCVLG